MIKVLLAYQLILTLNSNLKIVPLNGTSGFGPSLAINQISTEGSPYGEIFFAGAVFVGVKNIKEVYAARHDDVLVSLNRALNDFKRHQTMSKEYAAFSANTQCRSSELICFYSDAARQTINNVDLVIGRNEVRRRLARILDSRPEHDAIFLAGGIYNMTVLKQFKAKVGACLRLSNSSGGVNCRLSSFVGGASEKQRPHQETSADSDKKSRQPSGALHALGGFIHRLRSVSHALLGDKIVFLALIAFPFADLARTGAFFAFDYPNGNTRLKCFGLLAALLFGGLSAICLLLGLQ